MNSNYTCAILDDDGNASNGGPVKCWGSIINPQDRNAYNAVAKYSPSLGSKQDGTDHKATAVALGYSHICVILDDDGNASNGGPVQCWGIFTDALGGHNNKNASLSKKDGSAYMATAIVAEEAHTCAILTNKKVKCWGDGFAARKSPSLGTKADGSTYTTTAIASGESHICAILNGNGSNGGPVKCWGDNKGQLGGSDYP